jgi:ABC-type uncharacterized transport system involved in gliding motility auxiliary subunit
MNQVLAPWEMSIENKVVIDPVQSLSGDPLTPVINGFEFSQITKDMENMLVALPIAAPIQPLRDLSDDPSSTDITYTPLGLTSSRAWAESDTDSTEARYDQGTDLAGPLVLVASIEAPAGIPTEGDEQTRNTRIVLVGDSDFVANDVLSQIPNGQYLVLNAVNWLTEEQELIAIGPKSYQSPTIHLSAIQEGAVCFGSLVLIPAVIVIAGAIVWLKRR